MSRYQFLSQKPNMSMLKWMIRRTFSTVDQLRAKGLPNVEADGLTAYDCLVGPRPIDL